MPADLSITPILHALIPFGRAHDDLYEAVSEANQAIDPAPHLRLAEDACFAAVRAALAAYAEIRRQRSDIERACRSGRAIDAFATERARVLAGGAR